MVYTGSESPVVEQAGDDAVDLRTRLIGSLDGAGILTPRNDEDYTVSYSLAADSTGQWRIAQLPGGVLLPEPAFDQEFSAYLLHFLSFDRERAVPELRWASLRTAAPTLMRLLLGSTMAVRRPKLSYSKVVVTLPGAVIALGCPSGRRV